MLMTYLVDFLKARDPFKQSTVYKTLEKVDKGFKKLNAYQHIITRKAAERNFIYPTPEWNNLDYLLGWVKANAIPRLDALPELVADEAVYIAQHKSRYFNYYDTFFKQKASLEELRIRIEKDEKRELKTLAKEQRKLKARIDAQAGPSSQNKHRNKRGSLKVPSMIGDS
jgi:hypothetical protein